MRPQGKVCSRSRGLLRATLAVACALLVAGAGEASAEQLYGFGDDDSGQLGIGGTARTNFSPTAVPAPPGASGPFVQAAVAEYSSLFVTSTGQLYGAGLNGSGELGVGTNVGTSEPNSTPLQVSLPGATGPVAQVAANEADGYAVTATGQLFSFGSNLNGQLGTPVNAGTGTPTSTPQLISLPGATGPVVQVAAGYTHALALTASGQVFAFGSNYEGELGKAPDQQPHAQPAQVSIPGASGPVVQIAASDASSFAVTSTGQLFAFGGDNFGQLGLPVTGATNPHPTPTQIALPGATGTVAQVAAGDVSTLAVTSTGQLYAFGDNEYGQLGIANLSTENPTPAQVTLPGADGGVAQAAEGKNHGLALTGSGQLFGFGQNYYGQLGIATDAGTTNANPTPALVGGFPAGFVVKGLAEGSSANHSMVLAAPAAPPSLAPVPIPVPARIGSIPVSGPSAAAIKARLLAQLTPHGKAAKIAALRKRGSYTFPFASLGSGTLSIEWFFLPKGAHLAKAKKKVKPVLFASGRLTFAAAATKPITLKLTGKGKQLLRSSKGLKLTAKGSFKASGQSAVTASRPFKLSR